MKKQFTEEQIVAILRDDQVGSKTIEQLCRDLGVSQPDVKRLRKLEKENARLKRLLAEREQAIDVMKEFLESNRRGIGIGLPCKAEHPHHTWAWDFMEDRTESGRKLRILTVEDEFTRLCLAIEVEHRMSSGFVADTLMALIAEHGAGIYRQTPDAGLRRNPEEPLLWCLPD